MLNGADRDLISYALAQQSVAAAAVATQAGGVNNLGNRIVYLDNIHPESGRRQQEDRLVKSQVIMEVTMKAIRRSIKGEKDTRPLHNSMTPKSAIAIQPPKRVCLTHLPLLRSQHQAYFLT